MSRISPEHVGMWLGTPRSWPGWSSFALESDESDLLDPLLFQLARERTAVHAEPAGSF